MISSDNAIYLEAIRQALANGNAAVMVGAGFSKNAEGGHQFKTWPELGRELWSALNPGSEPKDLSSHAVIQLGEQFARVFSAPTLENVLKRTIPDERVAPGALHQQLLKLSWSEIFTTNYDTLLERAAENIVDRAHMTVCCREDIPQSKILNRRRIVKLHGSFPSQRPFIFTEEDYRTYPEKFAPFVNLVRQSLLENVLCLVGFSGDDPNFLHWIGWVRDVLDQHSLPVYLFVRKLPSLGEQKLLEGRRVVPVVLPDASSGDPDDLGGRYAKLFDLLQTPLKWSDDDWGKCNFPNDIAEFEADEEKRFSKVIASLECLVGPRDTYPGWLVAPVKVRRQFKSTLSRIPFSLGGAWLLNQIAEGNALVGLAILEFVAWQQQVLQQPLDDSLARLAITLLEKTADSLLSNQSDEIKNVLTRLGIVNQKGIDSRWLSMGLSVLRWSRQELISNDFGRVKNVLLTSPRTDVTTSDYVSYETVLWHLYAGERNEARQVLKNWTLLSPDPYFSVRKGALSAELGDIQTGIELCLSAIQSIRRGQKQNPESALLISQEAWACLIASHLRVAIRFSERSILSTESVGSEEDHLQRLKDLAFAGYDVLGEQKAVISALKAEASPPSKPKFVYGQFDLGDHRTVQNFGSSSELTEKVEAAFAWLSMAEEVALTPRMGGISFDLDYFAQAGWWAQYSDSNKRVLSIVVRCLNKGVLNPKDDTVPFHKTGWLSRYQIAQLDPTLATAMAENALSQVEVSIKDQYSRRDTSRVCSFFLEVFSRVVIRIQDAEVVSGFSKRLIGLHRSEFVVNESGLWKGFSIALARCFEALPDEWQRDLIPLVADLPSFPADCDIPHLILNWIQPFGLTRFLRPPYASRSVGVELQRDWSRLLDVVLGDSPNTLKPAQKLAVWTWLVWLDTVGMLSQELRKVAGIRLWESTTGWPVLPGFSTETSRRFPPPQGTDTGARLRDWILAKGITPFNTTGSITVTSGPGKAHWGFPGDNTFFLALRDSVGNEDWTAAFFEKVIYAMKAWWDAEGSLIDLDISRFDELRDLLLDRLSLVDQILCKLPPSVAGTLGEWQGEASWLVRWMNERRLDGANFWRFRTTQALRSNDVSSLEKIEDELARVLFKGDNSHQFYDAAGAFELWMHFEPQPRSGPTLVVDTWLSVSAAKRMPSLASALGELRSIVRHRPEWLSTNHRKTIGFLLSELINELSYDVRQFGSGLPDDEVPVLRFQCAELAYACVVAEIAEARQAAEDWLVVAENDPLPELRLGRYKPIVG